MGAWNRPEGLKTGLSHFHQHGPGRPYWLETVPTTKLLGSPLFRHQRTPALKKQPKRTKRKSAQWYEKEYAALHKLYNNRGISREEYERRMKIITDDLNGVADDDR